jgi:hypothetical protein
MDRSLNAVYQQTNDYISNYTDGNIDEGNRLRAINRAIEDLHRCLGLTCDETEMSFLYSQTNPYTSLPEDFDEPILLYYQNSNYNRGSQAGWKWAKYTEILLNNSGYFLGNPQGIYGQKTFSTTNVKGGKKLLQLGLNMLPGSIVNAFNTINLVSGTGDATELAVDTNFYANGGASVSFTIDPTLGNGYAGILVSGFGIMNVQTALRALGIYQVLSWLQTTEISNIQLVMYSENGSFTFNATTKPDGTAFTTDSFIPTQYPWKDVVISGNPDSQAITSYEFKYYEGASFGSSAIPYFRINDFSLSFPDVMNLVYYSQYKGTSADGLTKKIILDNLSDLPNFMQYYPDFLNMVALRAAYILIPQTSMSKEFMTTYRRDYLEQMRDYGRIYPRKRIINLGQTKFLRP